VNRGLIKAPLLSGFAYRGVTEFLFQESLSYSGFARNLEILTIGHILG
jgi:hypothetical protein